MRIVETIAWDPNPPWAPATFRRALERERSWIDSLQRNGVDLLNRPIGRFGETALDKRKNA